MDELIFYTVYYDPLDFPGLFALRAFTAVDGRVTASGVAHTANTLDEIRAKVPVGLYRMPPWPGDDLKIVETWI